MSDEAININRVEYLRLRCAEEMGKLMVKLFMEGIYERRSRFGIMKRLMVWFPRFPVDAGSQIIHLS
jgi:hypothetical protein